MRTFLQQMVCVQIATNILVLMWCIQVIKGGSNSQLFEHSKTCLGASWQAEAGKSCVYTLHKTGLMQNKCLDLVAVQRKVLYQWRAHLQ
jgi:hypothetical protein